jgi:uncharacterized protein (TIRG00374 family)
MRSESREPPAALVTHEPPQRRRAATFLSVAVSGVLLVGLYRTVDVRLMGAALLRADRVWLAISIGMILPITVLRAIRFFWVAPPGSLPGVGEALRLTLVASAVNVVAPAKAGDLIKSYFVARRGNTSTGMALAIIVYERLCDLVGLISWCVLGWLVARPQVPGVPSQLWGLLAVIGGVCGVLILSKRVGAVLPAIVIRLRPHRAHGRLRGLVEGWPDLLQALRGRRRWILPYSLLLWLGHLFQIWMFTFALNAPLSFMTCASLSAIALIAGQLPLTVAGLGARDVALVVLLSRYMAPESAAAMGILIATRNLLPPLFGIPIMGPYLSSALGEAQRWRREMDRVQ